MSSDEAKRIVCAGLERRKEERIFAEKESQLEQYEQEMISFCNSHCANAKSSRKIEETGRMQRELLEARRAAREAALAAEMEKDDKAFAAVRRYCFAVFGTAMVATWTPMEWWAAAALIAGLAVFPVAYIFRLYFPLEGAK